MIQFIKQLAATEIFPQPPSSIPRVEANDSLLGTVLHFVFATGGLIAVLVIATAGLQYILSQGEPQKTAKSKNTILFAVIGLVIAMTGYGLVTFVINRASP